MKIKHNNNFYDIESKLIDNKIYSVINDESMEIKAEKISDNLFMVENVNGKNFITFFNNEKNIYVSVNGYTFQFEKVDENTESNYELEKKTLDKEEIKPPMPGNIIKVLVNIGDVIEEATPVIIVEAMKMETTLYSSIAGEITQINVKEKEQVDSDQILLVIDKIKG